MVFNNRGETRTVCGPREETGEGWYHAPSQEPRRLGGLRTGLGEWPARGSPAGLGRSRQGDKTGEGRDRLAGAQAEELMETAHTQASSEEKKITSEEPRGLISITGPEPREAFRSSSGISIISQPRVHRAGLRACVSSEQRDRQRGQWEEAVIASLGANTMGNSEVGSDLKRDEHLHFVLAHLGDAKEWLMA